MVRDIYQIITKFDIRIIQHPVHCFVKHFMVRYRKKIPKKACNEVFMKYIFGFFFRVTTEALGIDEYPVTKNENVSEKKTNDNNNINTEAKGYIFVSGEKNLKQDVNIIHIVDNTRQTMGGYLCIGFRRGLFKI